MNFNQLKIRSILVGILLGIPFAFANIALSGTSNGRMIPFLGLLFLGQIIQPKVFDKFFPANLSADEQWIKKMKWVTYMELFFFALLTSQILEMSCSPLTGLASCPQRSEVENAISVGIGLVFIAIANIRYFLLRRTYQKAN